MSHKAIAVLRKLIDAFPEMQTDEPINGSDAVDTLCQMWDDVLEAVQLDVGTKVRCNGDIDVIEGYVDPESDDYSEGYYYILKEHGTQSITAVEEYIPDNVHSNIVITDNKETLEKFSQTFNKGLYTMYDICPSRDDAQPHVYENGICVFCQTKKE